MNESISLLSDIINFQLVVFGFSATLFTVLYAFMLSEKEKLVEISKRIKIGNIDPLLMRQESRSLKVLSKFRSINNAVIFILFGSLVTYILSIAVKNLQCLKHYYSVLTQIVMLSSGIILLVLIVVLVKSLIAYRSLTKT